MYRKRGAKNDFFYALVLFAILAVAVFNVAVEFAAHFPEAYFADFYEVESRRMAANADAQAILAMRAA
jgi:hypothetical protein